MNRSHQPDSVKQPFDIVEPLILINERETVVSTAGPQKPALLDRHRLLRSIPLTIVDGETLRMIQVLRLHRAVDRTETATGSGVLLRSLVQPCTDLHTIEARQDALREIAADDDLRRKLKDLVSEFGRAEGALYQFFNKGLYALFPYRDLKRAQKSAVNIGKIALTLPAAQTAYLNALMSRLRSYRGSSIDRMMHGSIYKTFAGLKSDKDTGWLTPKQKFIPRRFTKWMLAGPAVALTPFVIDKTGIGPAVSPLVFHIGLAWTGIYAFFAMFVKPVRDTGNFIEPLRRACVADAAFGQAVDAVGMIDELLSFDDYARQSTHASVLPTISDAPRHSFEASGLKNPVLAGTDADFVPNDVRMKGTRLTFISGPNSGGKTTICKSIVHNQLLAQAGAYVLAEKAAVGIAEMIRYQAPKFDGLQDDEGRFGTELARTRDIFYAASPKSLVILDELAEGTTYEERLQESYGILSDFHTIGNNTVLVTHNHSLVDRFMSEQKGQALMVQFNGDEPTYRIVPGISRVSHADRIAAKINFSRADRQRYLREKGYL